MIRFGVSTNQRLESIYIEKQKSFLLETFKYKDGSFSFVAYLVDIQKENPDFTMIVYKPKNQTTKKWKILNDHEGLLTISKDALSKNDYCFYYDDLKTDKNNNKNSYVKKCLKMIRIC